MPNFGLVVDASYDPISYEQYVAPFKEYITMYDKVALSYDALAMEANKWEKLAQESGSENSYKLFTTYAKELRLAALDLAENGLTNKTRGVLSNLINKYSSIILPIEEKYEYRLKLIEEQRKANPTGDIQWTTDYANMGLDNLSLNSSYSGRKLSDIEKEGFEQATAYSSRLSQSTLALADLYYRIRQGSGQLYANAFLLNIALGNDSNYDASSVKELTDLFNYIKQSQGIGISDSPYTAEQDAIASDRLASGILKGLTMKDSYQIVRDVPTLNNSSKNDKQTIPLYSGAVIVSNTRGTEYAYGINKEDKEKKKTRNIPGSLVAFTEDNIPVDSPALIYEDLKDDELLLIPDNIKNFKDYYVFYRITRDADGRFTGNNNLIAWVPAKTVKAENQKSEYNEGYDPQELPNQKEK